MISHQIPPWVTIRFPDDQRAAVDHLSGLIDESMLREIAEADYGRGTEEHLAALLAIWQGAPLGEMHHWFPMEVLELIRWSKPEDPDWAPGAVGLRGHTMRAFACAVLLATPNFEPDKDTLIQLVDSALLLGGRTPTAVIAFLTWRLAALGTSSDRPFFVLALVAMLTLQDPAMTLSDQTDLVQWFAAEEQEERTYHESFHENYRHAPWLFGLSGQGLRDDRWWNLILRLAEQNAPPPLRDYLQRELKLVNREQ
jgi:hypothetical protein